MKTSDFKIALVEDDDNLRFLIKQRLVGEGYNVVDMSTGAGAEEMILSEKPDFVLLDWMLPGVMGDKICANLRSKGFENSIIMITAKGQDVDKINAYQFGVTDYLTKPFNIDVLVALVGNKITFHKSIQENEEVLKFSDFEHHTNIHLLIKGDARIELTILENRILYYFLKNIDQVVSREDLILSVWGYSSDINTRTLDMHIVRLRKKIEDNPETPQHLETIRGVGYKFNSLS